MNRNLVIVDIQDNYGEFFTYEYLSQIHKFIDESKDTYNNIYFLYEPAANRYANVFRSVRVPKFIFAAGESVCKIYSSETTLTEFNIHFLLKDYPLFSSESALKYILEHGPIKVRKGEIRAIQHSSRSDVQYLQLISNEMLELIDKLKGSKVDLIGGGINKCVTVTNTIFKSEGIKTSILGQYCYKIHRDKQCEGDVNIFKTKPKPELFPAEIMRKDGSLKMRIMEPRL